MHILFPSKFTTRYERQKSSSLCKQEVMSKNAVTAALGITNTYTKPELKNPNITTEEKNKFCVNVAEYCLAENMNEFWLHKLM